jgi:hypothetical protein
MNLFFRSDKYLITHGDDDNEIRKVDEYLFSVFIWRIAFEVMTIKS